MPTYTVEVLEGEDEQKITIDGEVHVGSKGTDLVLNSPKVSAKHCTFFLQDDVLALIDHNSKHGTSLEGMKVQPGKVVLLNNGDVVVVGDVSLVVTEEGKGKLLNKNAGEEISLGDLGLEEETRTGANIDQIREEAAEEAEEEAVSEPEAQPEAEEELDLEAALGGLSEESPEEAPPASGDDLVLEDSGGGDLELDLGGGDDLVLDTGGEDSGSDELPAVEETPSGDLELDTGDGGLSLELDQPEPAEEQAEEPEGLELESATEPEIEGLEAASESAEPTQEASLPTEAPPEQETPTQIKKKAKKKAGTKVSKKAGKMKASGTSAVAKKKAPKKKKKVDNRSQTAGILTRFMALMGDLAIVHLLHELGMNIPEYRAFYQDFESKVGTGFVGQRLIDFHNNILGGMLNPLISPFKGSSLGLMLWQLINDFGLLLIAFFLVRMLGNAIFGASISQFLLGIGHKGNFIWARVGGVLRCVLEVLLLPISFIDLICVVKKKTLKETLSKTHLVVRATTMQAVGIFVLIPGIILASIGSPLFKQWNIKDGLVVTNDTIKPSREAHYKKLGIFGFDSKFFGFFSTYNNVHKLKIMPSYHIEGKPVKLEPKLFILSVEKNIHGEMRRGKSFELYKKLSTFASRYRLIENHLPNIQMLLTKGEGLFRPKAKEKFSPKDQEKQRYFLLNAATREEITNLFYSSLSLGTNTLIDHVQTYGPFIKGFVLLREEILKLVDFNLDSKFDIVKLGNSRFIQISENVNDALFRKIRTLYVPIESVNGNILEFHWDNKRGSEAIHLEFIRHFLPFMKIAYDVKWDYPQVETFEEFSIFHALEVYADSSADPAQRKLAQDFLENWYFLAAQKLMREVGEYDEVILMERNLEVMIKAATHLKTEEFDTSAFIQKFKEMKDAVKNNKPDYFELK